MSVSIRSPQKIGRRGSGASDGLDEHRPIRLAEDDRGAADRAAMAAIAPPTPGTSPRSVGRDASSFVAYQRRARLDGEGGLVQPRPGQVGS